MRVLDLALKDLKQILRDWKAAAFLLVSPIVFTLFMGYLFGANNSSDTRLPVGVVDQDGGSYTPALIQLLDTSDTLRPVTQKLGADPAAKVYDGSLAALVIIPDGYSQALRDGNPLALQLLVDPASSAALSVQDGLESAAFRLEHAARTAEMSVEARQSLAAFASAVEQEAFFDATFDQALAEWSRPAVRIAVSGSGSTEMAAAPSAYAHTAPGMMAQFAIAGLMGAAEILVRERKARLLQRLLTTAMARAQILSGHFLAMFVLILTQFALLIAFGQLALGLNYAHDWLATALVALGMALACAGMGLLIGVLARSEEQVIIYTLIPMFVFAGLGGAWVPLEVAPRAVQVLGHFTPVAWMMDGFKNILVRGLGWQAALLPAGVLLGFALGFVLLSAWRFRRVSG